MSRDQKQAGVCTQALITPALHAFTRKYPDIDLDVIASRDILDLAARVRIFRNLPVETLEQQRDQIEGRGMTHTTSERT